VYDKCWNKLYQLQFECNNLFLEQEDDSSDETDSGNEINTCSREIVVQSLNESLQSVYESPLRLKRIDETNYTTTEMTKIVSSVRKKIFGIPSNERTSALQAGPDSIIFQQLKEHFFFWKQTELSKLQL
jgi:hypothetical protein